MEEYPCNGVTALWTATKCEDADSHESEGNEAALWPGGMHAHM